jgi:penicillin-binding protein 2
MTVPPRRIHHESWRQWVVYGIAALLGLVFIVRLFSLQIINGDDYLAQTEDNRTDTISDPPARGIIYDRNGILLANNIASYSIIITPAYLPDDAGNIQQIYRDLSDLTGVEVGSPVVDPLTDESLIAAKQFAPCVPGPSIIDLVTLGETNAPYEPVKIQCNVGEDIAMIVRERASDWPGVGILIEPLRDYPTGSLTANIIGFLGPIPASLEQEYRNMGFLPNRDKVGYNGVEYTLNDVLMGTPGERTVEVDVAGAVLRNLAPPIDPVAGYNVVLTIDTRLQQAAQTALLNAIEYWNETYYGYYRISSGAVIAMDPQTGEILAMVQYPTYENNRMVRFIPAYYYNQLEQDPAHPLLNYAVSTEFPPGSTFKLTTALGVLNEGIVTTNSIIDAPAVIGVTNTYSPTDPGKIEYYYDWTYTFYGETSGLGKLPFLKCIALSSDACFYKVGGGYEDEVPEGLGILRLQEYARALGYDQQSGIELPGELSGLIPDPTWKRIFRGENWSTGDTYLASVGQGYVLATPLQVLLSAATIANDGKLMQPTVVYEIRDEQGNIIQPFTPRMRWDITQDPVIRNFDCAGGECTADDTMKPVEPWVVEAVQTGMHLATTDSRGTLNRDFSFQNYPIAVAGKTGTAEYCDDVANKKGLCQRGEWPSHGWTVAYAPFDNPEIAIIAFLYNAGEGGRVAAPIVRDVMDAYFALKAIDAAQGLTGSP